MTAIKPLETAYAGHRFRSRLEARWAVFFDRLGVAWEYEPQGYSLPSGAYLPDFWLPAVEGTESVGVWFEVKPSQTASAPEDARWPELVQATGKSLIVAMGMARPDDLWRADSHDGHMVELMPAEVTEWNPTGEPGWDNHRQFTICPACRQTGIKFEGRQERLRCHPAAGGSRGGFEGEIVRAYTAARSARFDSRGTEMPSVETLVRGLLDCFDVTTVDGRVEALRRVAPLIARAEASPERRAELARAIGPRIGFADWVPLLRAIDATGIRP